MKKIFMLCALLLTLTSPAWAADVAVDARTRDWTNGRSCIVTGNVSIGGAKGTVLGDQAIKTDFELKKGTTLTNALGAVLLVENGGIIVNNGFPAKLPLLLPLTKAEVDAVKKFIERVRGSGNSPRSAVSVISAAE